MKILKIANKRKERLQEGKRISLDRILDFFSEYYCKYQESEKKDRLQELLELLTPRQKEIILLYFDRGLLETARILGISRDRVYQAVRQSMKKMIAYSKGEVVPTRPTQIRRMENR